jgi:hypothetical protein
MSSTAGADTPEETATGIDARQGKGSQFGSGNTQFNFFGAVDPRSILADHTPAPPGPEVLPRPLAGPPTSAAFTSGIRDRYRHALAEAGLPVPDVWDEAALDDLRRAYQANAKQGPDATADLLESLCQAVRALPVLDHIGGSEISIAKLRYLYRQHIGRWPDSASREDMLILAASATVAERRRIVTDPGYSAGPLIALARFMLGIAGHWKAAATGPAMLDDPGLSLLADWLTGPLMQQREDAARYLAAEVGGRTWALLELVGEDTAERTRPAGIVLDLISERGEIDTRHVPCDLIAGAATPEECVKHALREVVSMLPEGEVLIDLCLPRQWLDADMEHWDVVQVGGRHESISRHYSPRLRWAMHRHDHKLRMRLEKRCRAVDWSAEPEAIPVTVTSDSAALAGWLESRDREEARHPPYFAAIVPSGTDHDPLGTLLWEGYGFAVWFGAQTAQPACAHAARVAVGMKVPERRNDLPQALAARLRELLPVIIWSDPEGRSGFPMPSSRGGGTRRGGSR